MELYGEEVPLEPTDADKEEATTLVSPLNKAEPSKNEVADESPTNDALNTGATESVGQTQEHKSDSSETGSGSEAEDSSESSCSSSSSSESSDESRVKTKKASESNEDGNKKRRHRKHRRHKRSRSRSKDERRSRRHKRKHRKHSSRHRSKREGSRSKGHRDRERRHRRKHKRSHGGHHKKHHRHSESSVADQRSRERIDEIKKLEKREQLINNDPQKALAERLAKVKREKELGVTNADLGEKSAAEIAQKFLEATANAPLKSLTSKGAVNQGGSSGTSVNRRSPVSARGSSPDRRKSDPHYGRNSPKRERERDRGERSSRSTSNKHLDDKRGRTGDRRKRRNSASSRSSDDDACGRFRPGRDYGDRGSKMSKDEWREKQQRKDEVLRDKVRKETGIEVPEYYKASAVNPEVFAEQEKKRKLLWSKKKDESTKNKTASVWEATSFSNDDSNHKFRRLMGIKEDGSGSGGGGNGNGSVSSADAEAASKMAQRQDELFRHLNQQYAVARLQTHTQRGSGLGFNS